MPVYNSNSKLLKEWNVFMKSVYTWYNSSIKIGTRHKICTFQIFFWCTRTTGGHSYVSTGVLIFVLRLIWKICSCSDFPKYEGLILKTKVWGCKNYWGLQGFHILTILFLICWRSSRKLWSSRKLGGTEELLGEVRGCVPPCTQ